MILGVQIIGLIFGLFMAYFVFLNYSRKEFSKIQFIMWEIIWTVYVIFVLFPNITSGVVHRLGILRGMDFFTILGFMFVLYLSFSNYISILRIRRKLEDSTRKEALEGLKNKSNGEFNK
ncbi:MAG: DUF2304 domain-containing protein [Parcubacteria group bacterium]